MEALQALKKKLCPKTLHVHLTRLSEKMLREYNIKRDRENGTSKDERGRKRSREEEHKKRSRISWEDREEEQQRLEKKLNMSQMKEGDKKKSSDDGNYRGDKNSTTSGSSGPAPLTFSSFNFHREIGRGAFGKVILATLKKSPKSLIALKIIRKKKDENPKSLENERRVLVTATGSAFLCGALAAFQTQGHVCFVMEYLSGGSLKHQMTMRRFLDLDTVLFYAAEMVCGLQYLHDRGIVHRDIKLDNVLLDNRGHIQIADFGLAAVNVSAGQTISDRAGTLYYLAPEIILRRNYNAAVDWWSFGIVVCRMATGKSPFYSGVKVQEVIRSIVKDQPRFVRGLSEAFYDLMNKLLDKHPHCRLGATGDIRAHPFFAAINWVDLEECRLSPPFQPSLEPQILANSTSSILEVKREATTLTGYKCDTFYNHQKITSINYLVYSEADIEIRKGKRRVVQIGMLVIIAAFMVIYNILFAVLFLAFSCKKNPSTCNKLKAAEEGRLGVSAQPAGAVGPDEGTEQNPSEPEPSRKVNSPTPH